jgi:hypothetical protein
MVWDEGNAIWRSEGISAWVRKLLATPPSGWAEIFSRDCIRFYWRYTVTFEGHPAFYGMVMAAGELLLPRPSRRGTRPGLAPSSSLP